MPSPQVRVVSAKQNIIVPHGAAGYEAASHSAKYRSQRPRHVIPFVGFLGDYLMNVLFIAVQLGVGERQQPYNR